MVGYGAARLTHPTPLRQLWDRAPVILQTFCCNSVRRNQRRALR